MDLKIDCQCVECNCKINFEIIEDEELLNLIQHGQLNDEQIIFLKPELKVKYTKNIFYANISINNLQQAKVYGLQFLIVKNVTKGIIIIIIATIVFYGTMSTSWRL